MPSRATVLAAIHVAAGRTATDPAILAAVAWRESRLEPRAKNRLSTAAGLMQFTEATWLEAIRDYGAAHGLAREAATLTTNPQTGEISARTPRDRIYLLNLRFSAPLSAAMAAERTAAMQQALAAALGRPPTEADLYAAHLLGAAGARRFLTDLARQPTGAAAASATRDAVQANPNIFFASNGRALALHEVHGDMVRSIAEGRTMLGSALTGRTQIAEAP